MNIAEAKEIVEKYSNDCDDPLVNRAKGFLEGVASRDALIKQMYRTLGEAREMLGVFEDNGGHDNLGGRGYAATLDHIDNDRALVRESLKDEAIKPTENKE